MKNIIVLFIISTTLVGCSSNDKTNKLNIKLDAINKHSSVHDEKISTIEAKISAIETNIKDTSISAKNSLNTLSSTQDNHTKILHSINNKLNKDISELNSNTQNKSNNNHTQTSNSLNAKPSNTITQTKKNNTHSIREISKIIINNEKNRDIYNHILDLEVTVSTIVSTATKNITKKLSDELTKELRLHGISIQNVRPLILRKTTTKNPLGISIKLKESESGHTISHYNIFIHYITTNKKQHIESITVKRMKIKKIKKLIKLVKQQKPTT
jgi:uncharacterized protein YcfL